jgi:hypothetical protein
MLLGWGVGSCQTLGPPPPCAPHTCHLKSFLPCCPVLVPCTPLVCPPPQVEGWLTQAVDIARAPGRSRDPTAVVEVSGLHFHQGLLSIEFGACYSRASVSVLRLLQLSWR